MERASVDAAVREYLLEVVSLRFLRCLPRL